MPFDPSTAKPLEFDASTAREAESDVAVAEPPKPRTGAGERLGRAVLNTPVAVAEGFGNMVIQGAGALAEQIRPGSANFSGQKQRTLDEWHDYINSTGLKVDKPEGEPIGFWEHAADIAGGVVQGVGSFVATAPAGGGVAALAEKAPGIVGRIAASPIGQRVIADTATGALVGSANEDAAKMGAVTGAAGAASFLPGGRIVQTIVQGAIPAIAELATGKDPLSKESLVNSGVQALFGLLHGKAPKAQKRAAAIEHLDKVLEAVPDAPLPASGASAAAELPDPVKTDLLQEAKTLRDAEFAPKPQPNELPPTPEPIETQKAPQDTRAGEGIEATGAVPESPIPAKVKLSPFRSQSKGEHIVSTALRDGDLRVTGKVWNSAHETMTMDALVKGMDDAKMEYGYIAQDANGVQRFVGREEAYLIAGKAGQRKGTNSKEELHSQDLLELQEETSLPETESATPASESTPPAESAPGPQAKASEPSSAHKPLTPSEVAQRDALDTSIATMEKELHNARKEGDEEAVTHITRVLPSLRAKLDAFKDRPEPVKEPVGEIPTEREKSPTGIRNSVVDAERVKRGLPERMAPLKKSFGTTWDEAMSRMDKDPQAGAKLVTELQENPRALTDVEDALLTHEQVTRQAAFDEAVDALNSFPNNESAIRAREDASNAVQAIYDAGQAAGTETGRGLAARRLMVNEDYSLSRMEAVTRAVANKGEPLSKEQAAEVKALHKRITDAEKTIADYKSNQKQGEAERTFENLIRETRKGAREAKKTGTTLLEKLKSGHDEALKNIRSRTGRTSAGVDPTVLYDVARIGAYHIANGAVKLAAFTQKVVEEVGEWIRPSIPKVFADAQKIHSESSKAFGPSALETAKTNAAAGKPLSERSVYEMAREKVNAGVEGLEPVMEAVRKDLEAVYPGITTREVRDAFSGYGKTAFPSKAQDKTKLREYRRLGQLVSATEDALKRQAPKKSGMQRDKPTQAVRDATKELKRVMDEMGIETVSPEQQLASANAARETALKNQIEDLDKLLQTGEKAAAGKPVPDSAEVERLRSIRDAMKQAAKDIEEASKPHKSPEQKALEQRIKAAEKSVAELDRRLREGDIESKAPKSGPTSDALEKLQSIRDSMQTQVREMRKASRPAQSPEQQALNDALTSRERWQQILNGEATATKPKTREVLTQIEEDVKLEIEGMKQLVKELRAAAKTGDPAAAKERAQIKAIEKSIVEYERRVKEMDFAGKGQQHGPPRSEEMANAKRAQEASRKMYEEAKKASRPVVDPDVKWLEQAKKAVAKRTEELQRRVREGNYSKPVKKDRPVDDELLSARFENEKAKQAYAKMLFEAKLKNRTTTEKILAAGPEAANAARAIITSIDFSAALRQGGFIFTGHPVRGAKAVPDMIKSMFSEKTAFRVNEEISNRKNAPLYKQSKLYLADQNTHTPSKLEEAYVSRWAKNIPLLGRAVKGSERAYTTFLNKLRADSFDAMAESLSLTGKATAEEAKAISNFINVATGRGSDVLNRMGSLPSAAFFSPRWLASRFQLLGGQPMFKGTARTKMLVAKEYGRFLTGVAVIYALGLSGAPEEDRPTWMGGKNKGFSDPRSSDFGKIKWGNTRFDPLVGLQQVTVFLSRLISGETMNSKGQIKPLRQNMRLMNLFRENERHDKPPHAGATSSSVIGRFLRTKLSPIFGTAIDISDEEDVVGNKVTLKSAALNLVTPLSLRDIVPIMREHGIPTGLAISIVSMFGMGVQNYDASKNKAKAQ